MRIFCSLLLTGLLLAVHLSGCATAIVREEPDCGTLFPATQEDIFGIYDIWSTSLREIVSPVPLKDWPAKAVADSGVLTLSAVGLLDLPFSLASDTLFMPYDLFMLSNNGNDMYANNETTNALNETKVSAGEFTRIYDPSAGMSNKWYINDHCFIRDDSGTWHLFGITHEEPADPIDEKNLAHATAASLLQSQWEKQPFALSAESERWNEVHLWAPHVIRHNGLYYMFYCAGDPDHTAYKIHLATSKDLVSWMRHEKNPMVVDGFDARDPYVMKHGDTWLMYYTANSKPEGGNHTVACVTSDDLVTWKSKRTVFTDPTSGTYGGPTESPFVVKHGDWYYLFIGPRPGYDGTDVFRSKDPFSWSIDDKVGHIGAHAAEVVRDIDGTWYISRCGWGRGGVYLAPLYWHDGQESDE
jgi:beta-fructofuranosidase